MDGPRILFPDGCLSVHERIIDLGSVTSPSPSRNSAPREEEDIHSGRNEHVFTKGVRSVGKVTFIESQFAYDQMALKVQA